MTIQRNILLLRRLLLAFHALIVFLGLFVDGTSHAATESERNQHLVFAHYMVCCVPAGSNPTIQDFEDEITEAQKHGIDGFALNVGGWQAKEPQYKQKTLLMYEAAKTLNTGFKLFVSLDFCCGNDDDAFRDAIRTFRDHPNQMKVDGRPVISTFGRGHTVDNGDNAPALIQISKEEKAFFVPYFFPKPASEHPNEGLVDQLVAELSGVDGYFYFGAAGNGTNLVETNTLECGKWRAANKLYMASVTPFYRGTTRAAETDGFSSMAQEWKAAIDCGANWVEIVTWNDFVEGTYIAPFGGVTDTSNKSGSWKNLYSHQGYLDASDYYIKWFKTRQQPKIESERIYYFYKPEPLSSFVSYIASHPLHANFVSLKDEVCVTSFLKRPVDLTINSGDSTSKVHLASGVQSFQFPSSQGSQVFTVSRDGKVIAQKTGEFQINDRQGTSFFNYFSSRLDIP